MSSSSDPIEQSSDLDARVQGAWEGLTALQRDFARFVVRNPTVVAVRSASSLSRELGISASSIVRTATALGYDGYPGLQRAVQHTHFAQRDLRSRFMQTEAEAHAGTTKTLYAVLQSEQAAISKTLESISEKTFDAFLDLLSDARQVYTFGMGISQLPVALLSLGLRQIGRPAHHVTGGLTNAADEMHGCDERDVLVASSITRYSRRTVEILDYAIARGVRRAVLTDDSTSPLAGRADIALYVGREPNHYFTSATAAVSLMNAVLTGMSLRDPERTRASLDLMEDEWRDAQAFYTDHR